MKQKASLVGLITIIPLVGYLIGLYVRTVFEGEWLQFLKREAGTDDPIGQGHPLLKDFCTSAANEGVCTTYQHVLLLQNASICAVILGTAMLAAIHFAARSAAANRHLLVTLFSPGIKLVLILLFLLVLLQGAIATYGIYILEATATKRVHFWIVGSIGLGALLGAFSMLKAGLSISRRANSMVFGKLQSGGDQPRLWEFVIGLARKLGATPPHHIVIGLDPNFYVTSADVTVLPGPATCSSETLYLSLPLMRILTHEELAAVVGHELGHFRGEDTKFSLRFYPIYAGSARALEAIRGDGTHGIGSLGLLPAFVVLSFFLEKFSVAERTIGREREFEADRAGASVASPRAIATSLLKVGVFTGLWAGLRGAMVEALGQGKAYKNVSSLFAEGAASAGKPEFVDEVAQNAAAHPTDSHPPTGQRVEAMGFQVSDLRSEALHIPESSSAELLTNLSELEEFLTELEHRVLLEMGYATLPQAEVPTTATTA